jgi:hypothetical protein
MTGDMTDTLREVRRALGELGFERGKENGP